MNDGKRTKIKRIGVLTGKSNKLIGKELWIGHEIVESHLTKPLEKMEAGNVADRVRMALTAATT